MATVSKYASYHTVISGGYTDYTNAYADDGVYATAAPAKSSAKSAYWGFAGFSTDDIPDGATINSVAIEHEFKVSTKDSNATEYYRVYVNTTTKGDAEQKDNTEPLSDTIVTHTVTSGISLSDLRNNNSVRLRTRSKRGASDTAVTFYIDYVKITVDYTTTQNYSVTLTDTLVPVDTSTNTNNYAVTKNDNVFLTTILTKITHLIKILTNF